MEETVDDEQEEDWSLPVEDDHLSYGSGQTPSKKSPSFYVQSNTLQLGPDKSCISKYGHQRTIIQIDIDCFYAQVEMIRNPELRNKPLGIKQKYLLVTCNYVARQYGVTKLMGIKEAKEKCPGLVIVSGEDLTHYREMSYKISEFLLKYTANVERLGFDENFLDVSEMVYQRLQNEDCDMEVKGHIYGNLSKEDQENEMENTSSSHCLCGCRSRLIIGSQIASEIREALNEELGITCCAGISYNKLLAKLVGSQHKPNQQTTLFPEQTSQFMSNLSRARDIPGVGWTTSKKLSSLGVCSVVNLQEVPLSDLIEEIGEPSAVHIKELSFGVDDSPVIPFKRPQTLSDEDSFKKCSTEVEVRSKVRELMSSLIIRLIEDGRIPHTLRLTIRRFTTTNKYTSRESRQCPIPSNILSKAIENTEQSVSKLLDIVMSLFYKLVDINQPFHLTLINIAFCNLQDKARNSISSFFSPKKIKEVSSSAQAENIHHGQEVSKETNSVNKNIKSPTSKLQNWLNSCKSDRKSTLNHVSNAGRTGSNSVQLFENKSDTVKGFSEINETVVKTHEDKRFFGIGVKRKKDIEKSEEMIMDKKKKIVDESLKESSTKTCYGGTVSYNCESRDMLLPPDIDKEVFLSLPFDMKQEIIQDFKSKSVSERNYDNNVNKDLGKCENSVHERIDCIPVQRVNSASLYGKNICSKSPGNEILIWESDKEIDTSVNNSVVNSQTYDKGDNSNLSGCEHSFHSQSSNSFSALGNDVSVKTSLPPDVDQEVFVNLPADIQKEILEQYKCRKTENKSKSSSCVKQNLASKKPSILSYFGKARK